MSILMQAVLLVSGTFIIVLPLVLLWRYVSVRDNRKHDEDMKRLKKQIELESEYEDLLYDLGREAGIKFARANQDKNPFDGSDAAITTEEFYKRYMELFERLPSSRGKGNI